MKINDEINEVMQTAIDRGMESIEKNIGPLIPFAIVQNKQGENVLHKFADRSLEQGLKEARRFVESKRKDISVYAIAWEGSVSIGEQQWDAVFVEAGSAASRDGVVKAQRYEKKDAKPRSIAIIGDAVQVEILKSRLFAG